MDHQTFYFGKEREIFSYFDFKDQSENSFHLNRPRFQ